MEVTVSRRTISRLVTFSLLTCFVATPTAIAQSTPQVRFSEGVFRRKAVKSVLPKFPAESFKKGSHGVAVAELSVDEKGDVESIKILDSPDEAIKQAVTDAANQWKFSPSKMKGAPIRLKGKLTFYFVIEGGRGRVENPKLIENPGYGRRRVTRI